MQEYRFDGEVAVITGVSRLGLGRAYAELLAARGCKVVINDLGIDWTGGSTEAATDVVTQAIRDQGGEAVGVTGDVVEDSERIVAKALDTYGRLDILINNAGSGGDFDQQVNSHARGTYRMMLAAWPQLSKSENGRIINTSSSATWGSPLVPGYETAKSGIIALSRGEAIRGQDEGVRVNVVMPTAMSQAHNHGNMLPPDHPLTGINKLIRNYFAPEHVAAFVAWLAHASNDINGQTFAVGAGAAARVVQARGHGGLVSEHTPEAWDAVREEVMSIDELTIPSSMWGAFGEECYRLGGNVAEQWDSLDLDGLPGDGKRPRPADVVGRK